MESILRNFRILSNYDFRSRFKLIFDIIVTKILFGTKFRKIKNPYYILGSKFIDFGKGFSAGINLRLEVLPENTLRVKIVSQVKASNPKLSFGEFVQLNDNVHIACIGHISIGNKVLVGSNVLISDHNHGRYSEMYAEQDSPLIPPNERPLAARPIVIHDNVWIGDLVSILPGSEIGEGAIIGTQSVVSGKIPPYSIAIGSPAKVVKVFDFALNKWVRT